MNAEASVPAPALPVAPTMYVFDHPTAEHIAEVRKIVRGIVKRHGGENVHVRKGKGSCCGSICISGNPYETDTTVRIAVCEALLAAGYEAVHAPYGHSLAHHHIRLAREWDHASLSVMVAKLAKQ